MAVARLFERKKFQERLWSGRRDSKIWAMHQTISLQHDDRNSSRRLRIHDADRDGQHSGWPNQPEPWWSNSESETQWILRDSRRTSSEEGNEDCRRSTTAVEETYSRGEKMRSRLFEGDQGKISGNQTNCQNLIIGLPQGQRTSDWES